MPALYIGHGAPPLLDDPVWAGELKALAESLPRPRNIVVISAHWEAAPAALSAPGADLVYDFAGFDPKYYRETYSPPAADDLNADLTALFSDTIPLHQHRSRGMDHGAWVPLKIMYPEADVPVTQLSMPTQDPESLLAMGQRLRALKERGTLIIGSGFLTHGLPFLKEFRIDAEVPGWSSDFDLWASERLAEGDVDSLVNFREQAPGMPYAHPTAEHYTPLFIALGAGLDPSAPPEEAIAGYWMGLSKRSFIVR